MARLGRRCLIIAVLLLGIHASPAHAQSVPRTGNPLAPYLAWTLAADGTPFLLDARYTLWELEPIDLAPVRRTASLLPALGSRPVNLAVTDSAVWVGAAELDGTKVLDRATLEEVGAVDAWGAMAAGPDGEIYLIDGTGLYRYEGSAPDTVPQVLIEPWEPDEYYGSRPVGIAVDFLNRLLYVTLYNAFGSSPHNSETLSVTDLDAIEYVRIDSSLGSYSRPTFTADGSLMAVAFNAKSGALGSWVGLWQDGKRIAQAKLLDGQVALDPQGDWLYLLNDRGLWTFSLPRMALASALPLLEGMPESIAVAPDGETVYLNGRTWNAAISAQELRSMRSIPVTALSGASPATRYRLFASPTATEDGTVFAVRTLSSGPDPYGFLVSTDSQRTWTPNPSLSYPLYAGVDGLSISPAFAGDGTVVASAVYTDALFRSTDRGVTWSAWEPPIAYTAEFDNQRDVVLDSPGGGSPLRLTNDPADDENPAWSPAWTYVAFQSNRGGDWNLYSIRAGCDVDELGEEACDLRRLTDDPADDLLPAWSPDGTRIAFVSTRSGDADIYVLNLADGSVQRITDDSGGDWRPAWLPDSEQLIFTSARGGTNDLYLVRVPRPSNGEFIPTPEALVATPADERDAATSLQGGLLFVSDFGGEQAIYLGGAWDFLDGSLYSSTTDPYALGMQTRRVAGGHPSWVASGSNLSLLLARESDDGYAVLRTDFYGDVAQVVASSATFVGHPAAGPVFWQGANQ